MIGDKIKGKLIASRMLTDVDDILLKKYNLPEGYIDMGLFEVCIDALGYCAADDATKKANVVITKIDSNYGSAGRGNDGRVFGVLSGPTVSDVERGLRYVRDYVESTQNIISVADDDSLWMYVDCIPKIGQYFSDAYNLPKGSPIAFMLAPTILGTYGFDAALTGANVEVVQFWEMPIHSNMIGAIVTGTQAQCQTACNCFRDGVFEMLEDPIEF